MRQYIKQVFETLRWYECIDYALALLLMAVIPLSWRIATIVEIALLISVVVKKIALGKSQMSLHDRIPGTLRWCCYAMLAFFAVYLVSGICSTNQSAGIDIAVGKLSFVAFGAMALMGDWRWMTRRHLRLIFYVLWAVMAALFIVHFAIAAVKYIHGVPLRELMDYNFIPVHHSYIALFAVVAMVFGYAECRRRASATEGKSKNARWITPVLVIGEVLLTLFVVAVDSRSGMVSIALLVLVWAVDYVVSTRRWQKTLAILALVVACSLGIYSIVPPEYQRFGYAIHEILAGRRGDYRGLMARSGFEAMEGHWLTGLGSGDYLEPLHERYAANGFMEGVEKDMGTHNQYVETLLECGVPGVVVLLAFLLLPLAHSGIDENSKERMETRRLVWGMVSAIVVALFFEAMLGRQLGIVFTAYALFLIILWKQTPLQETN